MVGGGAPSRIGIGVVVVAHRFAAQLFCLRQAPLFIGEAIDGGLLMRIFPITQAV